MISTGRQLGDMDRHVGQRVKLARALAGVTQEKLGEAVGITFQQVQKYEKGVNRIGAGRLQQIADALGTTIDFFFEGGPGQAKTNEQADQSATVMSFLNMSESVRLMRGFMKIGDAESRRLVVELSERLSRS